LSPAQVCNRLRDTNRVGQNIASRNTLHGDALRRQPAIAFGIEQGPSRVSCTKPSTSIATRAAAHQKSRT
jgi:hypothetical protein